VGAELAAAYVEGGYDTYEDFWGLPASPGYEG
jgi:D-alanyl-D-alanine carboxypeptidase